MLKTSWALLILSLLGVCLSQRYNRCGRIYRGYCRKSLDDYPCSDKSSLLTKRRGKPLCPSKRPYCCIPSLGPKCYSRNGIDGFCDNHSNDTWTDAEGAVQPAANGGLHLSHGDWKCSIFNKKFCCTNRVPCGEGAYCGPYKLDKDDSPTCVNGRWDDSGDHLCPDMTLCCRSVPLPLGTDDGLLIPKEALEDEPDTEQKLGQFRGELPLVADDSILLPKEALDEDPDTDQKLGEFRVSLPLKDDSVLLSKGLLSKTIKSKRSASLRPRKYSERQMGRRN